MDKSRSFTFGRNWVHVSKGCVIFQFDGWGFGLAGSREIEHFISRAQQMLRKQDSIHFRFSTFSPGFKEMLYMYPFEEDAPSTINRAQIAQLLEVMRGAVSPKETENSV